MPWLDVFFVEVCSKLNEFGGQLVTVSDSIPKKILCTCGTGIQLIPRLTPGRCRLTTIVQVGFFIFFKFCSKNQYNICEEFLSFFRLAFGFHKV
jgi:hypothetical protein